jgi:hypothetical protein
VWRGFWRGRRTEEDAEKLAGLLMVVGQQDAAGLLCGQELCGPGCRQGRQERVVGNGHPLLKCCSIVRQRPLHTTSCAPLLHASVALKHEGNDLSLKHVMMTAASHRATTRQAP